MAVSVVVAAPTVPLVRRRTLLAGAGVTAATACLWSAGAGPGAARHAAPVDAVRGLVPILEGPVSSIGEVAGRLAAVRDHMTAVSEAGERDGIACFARLYTIITETVDAQPFTDRAFLVRLDVEFASRFFAALLAYARDPRSAPARWRLLFDRRTDRSVTPVRFAAAGVNAHINYDLAAALLATWPAYPPTAARQGDYDAVNEAFAVRMDGLRELFASPLSSGVFDGAANRLGDLLVRGTRTLAWDLAADVWAAPDRPAAAAALDRRLDEVTAAVGAVLLDAPLLPL